MNKFISIGMKLYNKDLSEIVVREIDKNSIKVSTQTHGLIEFPKYEIGKTIYIKKIHSNKKFESPELYFKFLEQEKIEVDFKKKLEAIKLEFYKMQGKQTNEESSDIKYRESPQEFTLHRNDYLNHDVNGYFHQYYTGYQNTGNPDFLNVLKNTFNSTSHQKLRDAQKDVLDIITKDIESIMRDSNERNYLCMCVPRSKALNEYSRSQLMFSEAVSIVAQNTEGLIDGTGYIVRHKNTRTTHLRNQPIEKNDGPKPYPGITQDTCYVNRDKLKDKKIILVDDIYTKTVNVDEDCIQALFDNGAKDVILYVIGYTRRL